MEESRKNPVGETPAIGLINPKYPHNVGAAMRAASCFGFTQLWWTGKRVTLDIAKGERLPREERMKGYKDVAMINDDKLFDRFPKNVVPVAIELRTNSENLLHFEHPENALYVFGPEDGSIPSVYLQHCHRFVMIPTRHCTNLAAAVYLVLYDRMYKRWLAGLEEEKPLNHYLAEHRGPVDKVEVDRVEMEIEKIIR